MILFVGRLSVGCPWAVRGLSVGCPWGSGSLSVGLWVAV
jgi:hypothetical protein